MGKTTRITRDNRKVPDGQATRTPQKGVAKKQRRQLIVNDDDWEQGMPDYGDYDGPEFEPNYRYLGYYNPLYRETHMRYIYGLFDFDLYNTAMKELKVFPHGRNRWLLHGAL